MNIAIRSIFAILLCGAMLAVTATAKDYWLDETPAQRDVRMQWWRDARLGMFIHWGLYAVPAGEWNGNGNHAEWIRHTAKIPKGTYDKFLGQFNPTRFDADQWVSMAKGAGMKYIVITSKHHDGFCLWPSKLTEYDIESTPFKRDILGELTAACEKHGVKMCFYHSIMDWGHEDYPPRGWEKDRSGDKIDMPKYTTYMKGQLKELIESYDPAVLWFDGEWEGCWDHDMGKDLYQYVRSLKPDIIINNRVDKGRKGMQGMTKERKFRGDFGTPEQEIPHTGIPGVDWESCMTMNRHWGWNKSDKDWKSTEDLLHKTIDIASKGGNYLLNIGPKADGTFPDESIERLANIGKWMEKNGEAIYGTSASPTKQPSWGRVTTKTDGKNTTLYLHVFEWADGESLRLALGNEVTECFLLTDPGRKFKVDSDPAGGIRVHTEGGAPDAISSTIVLKVKGEPLAASMLIVPGKNGVLTLEAADANIHNVPGSEVKLEKKDGSHMNIGFWMDAGVKTDWSIRVDRPGQYEVQARIAAEKVSKFTLEAGTQELSVNTASTGSYDTFKTVPFGKIALEKGKAT
ncbi:MAG: alpha-L-fucosidase, partial [Kiritimatiellia bacterium]|nr:alpha-L-fucosidase [Kiritimatiellia bacterium]